MNTPPVAPSRLELLSSHTLAGARADYARARSRQQALSAYATPEEVVAALKSGTAEADDLVDALLVEAQSGARSLQEVLLQGLLPDLVMMRSYGEVLIDDIDTLESLLTLAFAEAVAAYRGRNLRGSPSAYLLRRTKRLFLRSAIEVCGTESSLVPVGLKVFAEAPDEVEEQVTLPIDSGTSETSALLDCVADSYLPLDKAAGVLSGLVHGDTVRRASARVGQEVRRRRASEPRRSGRGRRIPRRARPALRIRPPAAAS